jgi:hypothetical protein
MIQLTIYVDDITTVMTVFTHIKIYTATSEGGTYTLLTSLALVAGQSTYSYTHATGTSATWYRSSYWSVSTESSLSDPVQGTSAELYHYATYPSEVDFSTTELTAIRKIRKYIGDFKGLKKIYSTGDDLCTNILEDYQTVDLGEKGWPVYISIDGQEYTSLSNPVVQGYRYCTFSGTLVSGSNYPSVNIWLYTFKFSDREVYEAYQDVIIPPGLTSATATQDHLILQTAIDLLENMTAEDVVDDGAVIRDDQSLYDPSPGLRERDALIKRLQKRLDELVKQYMMGGVTGVLID